MEPAYTLLLIKKMKEAFEEWRKLKNSQEERA
jgi:hypothetical protein